MNSMRSMWKLFVGVAGMGLLITNCTIKTEDGAEGGGSNSAAGADNTMSGECSPVGKKFSGCLCASKLMSYQVCTAEGIYGACVCDDTSTAGSSSGGASSAGATSTAGTAPVGDAGAGGQGQVVYSTCVDCLVDRCQAQFDACDADSNCISTNADGSGQFERISKCINEERASGLVKRDVVRGCGVTIGVSADPDVISAWAPEGMAATTTDLLNCLADAPGAMAASWANDDANYPVDGNDMINPAPWPAGTCAKDACTSAQ
ncbi:MAG: hypothetical protein ABIQ16_16120 [Polyangiaceae bacterium]